MCVWKQKERSEKRDLKFGKKGKVLAKDREQVNLVLDKIGRRSLIYNGARHMEKKTFAEKGLHSIPASLKF